MPEILTSEVLVGSTLLGTHLPRGVFTTVRQRGVDAELPSSSGYGLFRWWWFPPKLNPVVVGRRWRRDKACCSTGSHERTVREGSRRQTAGRLLLRECNRSARSTS